MLIALMGYFLLVDVDFYFSCIPLVGRSFFVAYNTWLIATTRDRYFFVPGLCQDISFGVVPCGDLRLGVCKAKKKIQAQLSAEAQRKLADFVIENNGSSAARWLWFEINQQTNG